MLSNGLTSVNNDGVSEARKGSPTFSHLGAVGAWVMIQLGALGLAAGQVPLADEMARPVEGVAIQEMVIVQAGAAGMLSPVLFRNVGTTLALVASTWPFLQLASMLSATPGGRVVSVAIYLAMWMGALGLAGSMLRSERARLRAVALATSFVISGPLLGYLRHEFDARDDGARESAIAVLVGASPITGSLNVLNGEDRSAGAWVSMGGLLVAALAGSVVMRRRGADRDNLSTGHPQGPSAEADAGRGF
jgi:hypothetical protein